MICRHQKKGEEMKGLPQARAAEEGGETVSTSPSSAVGGDGQGLEREEEEEEEGDFRSAEGSSSSIGRRSVAARRARAQTRKERGEEGAKSEKEGKNKKEKGKKKKKEKKKKKKKKDRMFDEEVDRYDTYEDYLDSLVSEEDHFYLEDEEMARIIAELGYRSSGDTLSRENFYKMKARLAEKRLLTGSGGGGDDHHNGGMNNSAGGSTPGSSSHQRQQPDRLNPDAGALSVRAVSPAPSSSSSAAIPGLGELETEESRLVTELRSRAREINNGELHTVIFMQTSVPRKSNSRNLGNLAGRVRLQENTGRLEVSGHIDLAHRQRTENFLPYLTGEKRLVPKSGDLTFYNWARGKAELQSTPNFEVLVHGGARLMLRHRASDVEIEATNVEEEGENNGSGCGGVYSGSSGDHSSARTKIGFTLSGWRKLKIPDDFGTVIFVYDIKFPKATS